MNESNNQPPSLLNSGGARDFPPISANFQRQQQPRLQGITASGQGGFVSLPKSNPNIIQRSSSQQQQRIIYGTVGNGPIRKFIVRGQAPQANPNQFRQQLQEGIPILQFRKPIKASNLGPNGVGMRTQQPPQLMRAIPPLPPKHVANHSRPNLGNSSSMSNSSGSDSDSPPEPKRPKRVLMKRLKWRLPPFPLQSTYFVDNMVVEKDADVIFICGDGGRVKGHKIILASISKFFTDIFMDQPLGEVSYVSMPDIRSDTMKLIILLGYKADLCITKEQFDLLKDQFDIFQINYGGLSIDVANADAYLDVKPGKMVENIDADKNYPLEENKRPPPPLKHPDQEIKSQDFACPLCPRRYFGNAGVTIHCGHQHAEYRKMFTFTGLLEDKLKCNHCHRKFSLPQDFHQHLHNGTQCIQDSIEKEIQNPIEESMPPLPPLTENNSATKTTISPPKREIKVAEEKENKKVKKTPKPKKPLPPPLPRSSRLSKRAAALFMAIVLSDQDEKEKKAQTKPKTVKRRSVELDYPPAECPICGSEVDNISKHLATEHGDHNDNVSRVSTELLRCQKCLMTFAICDLLSHRSNCGKNKPTQSASGEETKTSSDAETEIEKPEKDKVVNASAEPLPIPPINSFPFV